MWTDKEIFARWAPRDRRWSSWAKPSSMLSLTIDPTCARLEPTLGTLSGANFGAASNVALVVELSGARAVEAGIAVVSAGYQPVPLFNCCAGVSEVIDTSQLRSALARGAVELDRNPPRVDALPAFLIDRNRMGTAKPKPGDYDNRWMVFPEDFPSATTLKSARIDGVLWVTESAGKPADDLGHVLYGWQKEGLRIQTTVWGAEGGVSSLDVSRPARFGSLWHRALTLLGLRRNMAGGFGSSVPHPSSGGYG